MDIVRAKNSFYYKIGYGYYTDTAVWDTLTSYGINQVVANGNYFYKSLIDNNINNEPKTDSGTNWKVCCMIEDAYYSMNIENFYFEPIPPKHPPTVEYQSDDTRKINNLRQTLFQIAYRYVYMDWRKSTFSPASIVPVPQVEEQTATGLANEIVSLNNQLMIVVNSGGEEVRAIEVIGRSSQDPSKWFLIETISKFEEQERGVHLSKTTEPSYTSFGISVPDVTVIIESGVSVPETPPLQLAVFAPIIMNTWISVDVGYWGWTADILTAKSVVVTCSLTMAKIISIPSWLSVHMFDSDLVEGMSINSGTTLQLFPKEKNLGTEILSGIIVFTADPYIDQATISVYQAIIVPLMPVTIVISLDPYDISGMTLGTHSGQGTSGSTEGRLYFVVNHPSWSSGQSFEVYWRAIVNGVDYGHGVMIALDELPNERIGDKAINFDFALVDGDTVDLYLAGAPIVKPQLDKTGLSISAVSPTAVIKSSIAASGAFPMVWTAAQSGSGALKTTVITALPNNCYIIALPLDANGDPWITVIGAGGYSIGVGSYISNLDTIYIYPSLPNLGIGRAQYLVLGTNYGDTLSLLMAQDAVIAPPPGVSVSCTLLKFPGEVTMVLTNTSASATSGQARINWACYITGLIGATIYWKAYQYGSAVLLGSGNFPAVNGNMGGNLVLNSNLLPSDVVTIYFSHLNDIIGLGDTPNAPVAIAATGIFGTGFSANWQTSYSATGYRLDVSTSSIFSTFVTGFNNLDVGLVLTKAVTGLNTNTKYYYRVRAYKGLSTSINSNVINTTTSAGPSTPSGLVATQLVKNGFLLTWNGSVPNVSGYKLDIATDATFLNKVVGYDNLDVGLVLSKVVTGLAPTTTYRCRVRAYDSYGVYSGYSTTLAVTTLAPNVPAIPVLNNPSNITKNSFTASWGASLGATGYRIDVSKAFDFSSFVGIYNNLDINNVTSLDVTGLQASQGYYYRVRAYNADGTSSSSASKSVTTLAEPLPTITLSPSLWQFTAAGVAGKKAITVTVSNATSWGIYFPSLNNYIKLYGYLSTYVVELYYDGAVSTGDSVQFWVTGPGGTVTTQFTGRR